MKQISAAIAIIAALSFGAMEAAHAAPFDYFQGQWTCKTDAGSNSALLFHTVLNEQWLVLENSWEHPVGAKGEYIEYYRRDPDGTWWVNSVGSDDSLFVGMSPDWKDDQLVFEGTNNYPSTAVKSREVFVRWKDGELERQHLQLTPGGWFMYSRSVCRRV